MQNNWNNNPGLARLLGTIPEELGGAFERMGMAEDEIRRMSKRHPAHRDVLFHSFSLLRPSEVGEGIYTQFVYLSHLRELLERIVSGADTRPATGAELAVICAEVSQRTPMHGAAAGLYFRLWAKAFPTHPHTAEQAGQRVHYENLFAAQIDELEAELRAKSINPERRLGDIECEGRHHREQVDCVFAKREALAA